MKAPAFFATLTVFGSLAFAAGQSRVEQQRPPSAPSDHTGHSAESFPATAMSVQGSGCNTEPQSWFNPIPKRLRACTGGDAAGVLPRGAADVNADGIIEYFDADYATYTVNWYQEVGPPVAGPGVLGGVLLWHTTTEVQPTETIVVRNSVLTVGDLKALLESYAGYGITSATMTAKGWRDCDGDRDLDLVAEAAMRVGSERVVLQVWFENTGFEADPPPLAADINGDGVVDGKDLASVIAAWTP